MGLELFAQPGNNAAFQAGFVIGVILAVIICASIPISVGMKKGHPVLGVIGGIFAGGTAVLFGCLGGLPMAAVFVVIILCLGDGNQRSYGRYRNQYSDDYDDYEDEEEEERPKRRKKKKREDYEDEEDDYDRPRRRDPWDR